MLALHDPLDRIAHVAADAREDVLGHLLGVELLVEVARAADLRDALVDRDRAHLRRPRRHDPLPTHPAVHDAGDLLDLPRQQPDERAEAGHPEALEADRVEEHPDPAPVGRVADRPREERNGDQAERLAVHPDLASLAGRPYSLTAWPAPPRAHSPSGT
jgi:hypothetical protein